MDTQNSIDEESLKLRRRSSISKVTNNDYINARSKHSLYKALTGYEERTINFADLITRINRKSKMQERALLISEASLYVLESGSLKVRKRIPFNKILGISVSPYADNFLIVHNSIEDLILISKRKQEIYNVLKASISKAGLSELILTTSDCFPVKLSSDCERLVKFEETEDGVKIYIYSEIKKS